MVVNAGDTQTIRFYDDPLCTLTILKRDRMISVVPGSSSKIRLLATPVRTTMLLGVFGPDNGLYTTDTDGTVTITGLAPNSTVVVSEKKAPNPAQ